MKITQKQILSEGIAMGKVYLEQGHRYVFSEQTSVSREKSLFLKAVRQATEQIDDFLKTSSEEDREYLTVQRLLIQDPVFMKKTLLKIEEGALATVGLSGVLDEYAQELKKSENRYLQERFLDIEDAKERILNQFAQIDQPQMQGKVILVAEVLHPSFLIQHRKNIVGVITQKGGFTSHGAILCRQWNIPYILSPYSFPKEKFLIIDSSKREIYPDPSEELQKTYREILQGLSKEKFEAVSHDGYGFWANVSTNQELEKVMNYGFDGVGLYRTEMIFMNRQRPLTLEEQTEIYSKAVLRLKGKPICFRTFDIGDDKQLPYLKSSHKGIENYLNNPELFETQIQALITSNIYRNLKIMFPMIYHKEEFVSLKNWVLKIRNRMNDDTPIQIGMMLETKEALDHIEDFTEVDFISVGTNDLIEALYHIDREEQSQRMEKYWADLWKHLRRVVEFCLKNDIECSVCGELASVLPVAKKFFQIGLKNLSVAAPMIRILNEAYREEVLKEV